MPSRLRPVGWDKGHTGKGEQDWFAYAMGYLQSYLEANFLGLVESCCGVSLSRILPALQQAHDGVPLLEDLESK